ncbi:glycosyltransferase family 4 protein (plasmid) [Lactiplantibacillus plantarum]|uniref:glycosyltransferase family 4 protein n=1 Tax=Lactiplantibacillus plantarum TaxID=1590 RepID=UPI00265D0C35|nr:glycosyltransferase family 4 protein [Lactiplantibacillus plantarum]WJM33506.1 glycosyltransferase family 4 protein [Lactiplantibacillus plantarum]
MNLLFVGVDSKRKGLIIAVDTINELNKNISGYKFTLTVIGNDEKWLKDNDNINVLGFLDKNKNGDISKIHNAYKAADLFILPTTAEAAGIVFAESSMYGLPILTYATGGVSTYVKNEVNGFTLPKNTKNFFEKIERLIENPGEYENMSYNAIQLYERIFNWDNWIADASKIIDDLVKKN